MRMRRQAVRLNRARGVSWIFDGSSHCGALRDAGAPRKDDGASGSVSPETWSHSDVSIRPQGMRPSAILSLLASSLTSCSAVTAPTSAPEPASSLVGSPSAPRARLEAQRIQTQAVQAHAGQAQPVASQPEPPIEAPVPLPRYDLASDVADRRVEAERDLGPHAEVDALEDVFVIAAPGRRGTLAGVRSVMRRVLEAYFTERFALRPQRAISVYLFPGAAPYNAYCKQRWDEPCISVYGFYQRDERRIVMNLGPGIGTLTHELVHPIVETDFPEAPEWLNEGIASLFEGYSMPSRREIHGVKNWRYSRLSRALHSKDERDRASLPALFAMSDAVFRGESEDLNYATARYFCLWLDQRNLLWPFYQRWRDNVGRDPTGEQAFIEVVGSTPVDADGAWRRWAKRL